MKTAFRLATVAAVALQLGATAPQDTIRAITQAFGPRGTVRVSRPTFIWQIWSRSANVTRVEMSLDSQPVGAKYDDEQRSILYTPERALTAGSHHVRCEAVFEGKVPFVKEWDTTIAPDAASSLPAPSDSQTQILAAVNAKRREIGLPPLTLDDRLDAAASAHVAYLRTNNQTGHGESPNNPGFLAATGGQRCEAFGWCTGCYEGVTVGELRLGEAIQDLFDAPYHRIPFLQPGSPALGGSTSDTRTAILFGFSRSHALNVSPADGQTGVPIQWYDHEDPSPLRDHTSNEVAGYPLVIAAFGPTISPLQVSSATLQTVDGESVDVWLQTAAQDEYLKNAAIIIPQKPLAPRTTYVATVQITYEGRTQTKTWKFTTGA